MTNNLLKLSALSIATSLALTLTGCGGDDTALDLTTEHEHQPVEATGQFIDAAVANLDVYQNGKKIDTTDSEGMFTYMTGSEVTFKLGKLILGSTMPKAIVTPADLSAGSDNVVEILQALQSLDEDNDPSNGIFIPQTTIDKLVTALDLSKDEVSLADTLKKDIPDLALVGIEDALAHFSMAQETVKTSDDLSKIANKFAGYWQQSCENGHQQVFQLAKDSVSDNVLHQTGQYVNRKYANADCTGSYNETIEYSDTDPLTLTIMGTTIDKNGKQVVNALRTEGAAKFLDSLVMATADSFSGGELTFKRNDSLAIDDTSQPSEDQQPAGAVEKVVNQMVGYWKSDCLTYENKSILAYIDVNKVDSTTIKIDPIINKTYDNTSCSGTPEAIYKDGSDVVDLSQDDLLNIVNSNRFIVEFEEDGEQRVESYNRIAESEFAAVAGQSSLDKANESNSSAMQLALASLSDGWWYEEGMCRNKSRVVSKYGQTAANKISIVDAVLVTYEKAGCQGNIVDKKPTKADNVGFIINSASKNNGVTNINTPAAEISINGDTMTNNYGMTFHRTVVNL